MKSDHAVQTIIKKIIDDSSSNYTQKCPEILSRFNETPGYEHLQCLRVDVFNNREKIDAMTLLLEKDYCDNGYIGFSKLVNVYFDFFSDYFYVFEQNINKILAFSRVIYKTENNLLPVEMGIVSGPIKYRIVMDGPDIGVMDSFYSVSENASKLLYEALITYVQNTKKISTLLCLSDFNSGSFQKQYQPYGWKKSNEYNATIYFPGYGKIVDNDFKPVNWTILELSCAKKLHITL